MKRIVFVIVVGVLVAVGIGGNVFAKGVESLRPRLMRLRTPKPVDDPQANSATTALAAWN